MSKNYKFDKRNFKSKDDEIDKSKTTKRGGRNSSKPAPRSKGSMNDISWYTPSPTALLQSAQVPRAWATGLEHDLTVGYGNYSRNTTPGFVACATMLDPIERNDAEDSVNVVSRKITAYIRSFNSGAKNYDPNDLMIRLLAEANFIAHLMFVQRAYYTAHMYDGFNRYMPDSLLLAQHIDADNLRHHLNDFVGRLNDIIRRAQSICFIPKGFNICARWSWLFANYYADTDSVKDQLYFMYPEFFYQFEIDSDTSMGKLTLRSWEEYADEDTHLLTYEGLCQGLEDMLSPIIDDQEFATMRGDMLKAYGATAYSFTEVTPAVALPVHDPVVLNQFKNIRTAPIDYQLLDAWPSFDIVQDEDAYYLKHNDAVMIPKNPKIGITVNGTLHECSTSVSGDFPFSDMVCQLLHSDHPLDTYKPDPTIIDNMEDSRLTTMVTKWVPDSSFPDLFVDAELTHGCDYVYMMYIGRRERVNGKWITNVEPVSTWNLVLSIPSSASISNYETETSPMLLSHVLTTRTYGQLISDISAFDYLPPIYFAHGEAVILDEDGYISWNNSYNNFNWPVMRVTNLAYLVFTMAKKMNHCAMQGLFNINSWMNPKDTKITSET